MPTEIKYFSNSLSGSSSKTIYVVPPNRNAEIIFNAFLFSASYAYIKCDNFIIASGQYGNTEIRGNSTVISSISPGHTQGLFLAADPDADIDPSYGVFTKVWHIGTSRAVEIHVSEGTISVSFAVIEKYK